LPTGRTVPRAPRRGYVFAVRNRYLDLLRAAAIVRVIVYHLFGWPWLSIVLPAMGIMFALAGSLTAASLQKRAARKVVTSRLRRLLPPLWLLGLIAVPLMLVAGWAQEGGDHPFSVARLFFWVLPLGDPPGSDKGIDAWEPLWYIRTYVWFILLSPGLYLLYRKVGWLAVAAPILLMVVLDKTGFSLPDVADNEMWDFATYGACWIAGFAHHDGRLSRARPGVIIALAVALGGAAIYWLTGHQGPDAWDLNDVSESQALWSIAVVLVVLRWQPPMAWLDRIRPLDKAVTLLNARAVTVYLWHNIAIAAIWPLLTFVAPDGVGHHLDGVVDLTATFALTAVAVVLFGWVEDVAARRRPRLWPTAGPALRPVAVPAEERTAALVGANPIGGGVGGAAPAPQEPALFMGPPGMDEPGFLEEAGLGEPGFLEEAGPGEPGFLEEAGPGEPGLLEEAGGPPRMRRPVPWAADLPVVAGPLAIGGGRHAAGEGVEPPYCAPLDLGLPVAGRRAEPVDHGPHAEPGYGGDGEAPLEGEIVTDGPPDLPWQHGDGTRPDLPRPHEDGSPDWFRQRRGGTVGQQEPMP